MDVEGGGRGEEVTRRIKSLGGHASFFHASPLSMHQSMIATLHMEFINL